MNNQEIVSKLWNLCNVLRDDGITYHQYVTELTYILFLKMAKETGAEDRFSQGITLIEGQKFTNGEKQVVLDYKLGQAHGKVRAGALQVLQGFAAFLWHLLHRAGAGDLPRGCYQYRGTEESGENHLCHRQPGLVLCQGGRSGEFMKGCWKRMPGRKNPGPGSISPPECSLM